MTNFEKIKNMSVEELADYISVMLDCRCCPANCLNAECIVAIEQWLNSEVEE